MTHDAISEALRSVATAVSPAAAMNLIIRAAIKSAVDSGEQQVDIGAVLIFVAVALFLGGLDVEPDPEEVIAALRQYADSIERRWLSAPLEADTIVSAVL